MAKKLRLQDERVLDLAEQLIQMPPGLVREGMIVALATAIQDAIDQWFRKIEGPA